MKTFRSRRIALQLKRTRKNQKRKEKARLRRIALARSWLLSEATTIMAPKRFALESPISHADVTDFLVKLRSAIALGVRLVILDFSHTMQMVSAGTLLLYSELQRLRQLYPDVRLRCRPSYDNTVNQVLQHLGIFSLLKFTSSVNPTQKSVVSWRHATALDIDCENAGAILESYEALTRPQSKLLFKGMSEAISNVVKHAYDEDRDDDLKRYDQKRWWMFSREEANRLVLVVCDLGVGIPNTLERKNAGELLGRIMEVVTAGRLASDADMIEAAMELARTRTRNPYQGKGMHDLKRIVESTQGAKLHIYSNRGLYAAEAGKELKKRNYPNSILGTVVVWVVPLPSELA